MSCLRHFPSSSVAIRGDSASSVRRRVNNSLVKPPSSIPSSPAKLTDRGAWQSNLERLKHRNAPSITECLLTFIRFFCSSVVVRNCSRSLKTRCSLYEDRTMFGTKSVMVSLIIYTSPRYSLTQAGGTRSEKRFDTSCETDVAKPTCSLFITARHNM